MSNDSVAVASAAIAGVAAALGGAWLGARLTRRGAREDRYQHQRADAYIEMLAFMHLRTVAVSRVLFPEQGLPGLLDPDEIPRTAARVNALLLAYGSKEIKDDLYPKWVACVQKWAESPPADTPADTGDAKRERFRGRNRVTVARDAVQDRVQHELAPPLPSPDRA